MACGAIPPIELPPLKLSDLRGTLIRLEETIIFALIERAQFAQNLEVYVEGSSAVFGDAARPAAMVGFSGSLLDFMLRETEANHALVRRYLAPDEQPFFGDLPQPILPILNLPPQVKPNTISTSIILPIPPPYAAATCCVPVLARTNARPLFSGSFP